ncbi:MAG: Trm112 family protein [Verrucomicrobiia bacterium]
MTIDKQLLDVLACPKCKGNVKVEGEKIVCQSAQCGLRYPIRDGIPVMLIDEAEQPQGK